MGETEVGDYILLCYVSFTKKTSKAARPVKTTNKKEATG
jgi:hypothetical protein